MDKAAAIITILNDARSTRKLSNASAKRIRKACDVIGLDADERIRVFGYLDYCDRDGNPYGPHVSRVW